METVENLDVISNLPSNVIENILTRMPLRDAVRTSILSSQWRLNWVSIPQLVFNKSCFPPSNKCQNLAKFTIENIVDQVLLLHIGPIRQFKLDYSQSVFGIDRWIRCLARNGIEKLVLEIWGGKSYTLPSTLFSCQNLSHLELYNFKLRPPPTFKGFRFLRCLDIQKVDLADNAIENLISNCPILERLLLIDFVGPVHVKLVAPNLHYLFLVGHFEDLCFKNTPLLDDVIIDLLSSVEAIKHPEQEGRCNLTKVLGCLLSIKKLQVRNYFLQFLAIGDVPERLPITYDHLKDLSLQINFKNLNEISAALCLCRSSPNLRKLEVYSDETVATIPIENFWEVLYHSDFLFNLQIVGITKMQGAESELEFIKFILARASALETMNITINAEVVSENSKIFIELMRFRRDSKRAEIIYLG